MRTDDFDFELPESSIAQQARPRGESRLLVIDDATQKHRHIRDLPRLLRAGDLLVVNDTKVIPARLFAQRELESGELGGRIELLLIERTGPRDWLALLRPAKKCPPGTRLHFAADLPDQLADKIEHGLSAEVVERGLEGKATLRFSEPIEPHLERLGHVPLPPYIRRVDDASDAERYQTLWARDPGAVAAPTAGLHFDQALLSELQRAGIERVAVTLHVGIGTFKPVTAERVEDHAMEEERWEVPAETAAAIEETRGRGGRIVAVGTTVVRTLESAGLGGGPIEPGAGRTALFITPGYRFQVVDTLLTNFHLPRSTLLMLVSAFAGRDRILAAYREAVTEGYRFYSYGDAMLLERRNGG